MANLHKTERKLPWLWRGGGLSSHLALGNFRVKNWRYTHGLTQWSCSLVVNYNQG